MMLFLKKPKILKLLFLTVLLLRQPGQPLNFLNSHSITPFASIINDAPGAQSSPRVHFML